MQTFHNATTGQSVEWNGSLDEFYAASDANQAGQWAGEAASADIPLTLVPQEIAPESDVEVLVAPEIARADEAA